MSERNKNPNLLTQPPMHPPEKIEGNETANKANAWFFNAQWEAHRQAREEDLRLADELGGERPALTHEPDYGVDNGRLINLLAPNMENPGTQEMLAAMQDMRQAQTLVGNEDPLRNQMALLQAFLNNPDTPSMLQ
jgi:hypothetical protein